MESTDDFELESTLDSAAAAADDDENVVNGYEQWNDTGEGICRNLSQTNCLMPVSAKRLEISVP